MKLPFTPAFTLAAALLIASASQAAPSAKTAHTVMSCPMPAATAKSKSIGFTCPVTGEKVASVKDAVGSSVYKGKKYYFCCPACKPMFDKDPAKYVKAAAKKHK